MLSLYDINKCSLDMFCYIFNFGLLPDAFDNFFTKVSKVHRHHTRSQCNFHVRVLRTIYVDKSVKCKGTLLWNQLGDNVKNSPNLLFLICHEAKTSGWQLVAFGKILYQASSIWYCEKKIYLKNPLYAQTKIIGYLSVHKTCAKFYQISVIE